jgi:hypothetical protein
VSKGKLRVFAFARDRARPGHSSARPAGRECIGAGKAVSATPRRTVRRHPRAYRHVQLHVRSRAPWYGIAPAYPHSEPFGHIPIVAHHPAPKPPRTSHRESRVFPGPGLGLQAAPKPLAFDAMPTANVAALNRVSHLRRTHLAFPVCWKPGARVKGSCPWAPAQTQCASSVKRSDIQRPHPDESGITDFPAYRTGPHFSRALRLRARSTHYSDN